MLAKFFKKKLNKIIVVSIACLLTLGGIGYFSYDIIKEIKGIGTGGEKIISDNEYYAINNKATDLQKEIYKELSKEINNNYSRDNLDIAILVTKSFVADYFTWTNKSGSYDIGGLEYISESRIPNFINQSRNEFYKYLSYYISEYEDKSDFLEVESVEASACPAGVVVEIDGKTYSDTFYVEVFWTYKPSDTFDTSEFQKGAAARVFVNDEGRFEIYEFYQI